MGTLTVTGYTGKDRNTVESGGGTPSRDSLVYGTYQPDDTTTGLVDASLLTDWNASTTDSFNLTGAGGQTYNNFTFYGDCHFSCTGDTWFNNCKFVGGTSVPSSASGVLNLNTIRSGAGRMICTDCEINPRNASLNRDAVVGHRYSLYRCKIQNGVDGCGIFKNVANSSSDVEIEGCWISNRTYWYPDYANGVSGSTVHTDGTHNDCIQIQGGTNIHIKGNYLEGDASAGSGSQANPDKPWLLTDADLTDRYNNGACLIIQNNVSAPTDNTVIIEDNFFVGGLSHMNIKPGMTFIYRGNKHYRKTAVGPSWSGYWIRFDDHTSTVTGITTGTNDNVWIDGPYAGTVLSSQGDTPSSRSDFGIHYNA